MSVLKGNFSLKLFIQFGSSEEYGAKISPFKEEEREYPSSPYALVKQLTTNTAMMLYYNYNFPVMVVVPLICLVHIKVRVNLFRIS